jgi:excisionase family DNA binding protein
MFAKAQLLTRREAAECLRQSVRMVDMLIASGELPAVRIGRSVRIRPSAIEYFISARESRIKVKVNRRAKP